MDEGKTVKTIARLKPEPRKKIGRPWERWWDLVTSDVKEKDLKSSPEIEKNGKKL